MIPEQLKGCNFCKILKGTKTPYEKGWQNKIYDYNLISMYFPKQNYGVLTGFNELGILDDDTDNNRLLQLYDENFKDTFQVRGHYYIKLKGWDGKKIIFYDENNKHMGELQGRGQQCVGAGSLHPSGEYYEVKKDIPIIEIPIEDFLKVFNKFQKKVITTVRQESKPISWNGDNINNIPIENILYPTENVMNKGSIIQGTHPIHGSDKKQGNFAIDTSNNTWYCFRCGSGGGIWSAIALSQGLKNCNDLIKYSFTTDEKKQIVKIANKEYNLEFPKDEENKFEIIKKECISITKYKCPKCNKRLLTNGRFVKCKNCTYFKSFKKYIKEKLNNNIIF